MSFNVGPRVVSATGGSIKRVGNYRIHTFPSELVTDGLVLNLDAGDPRSYPGIGTSWTDFSGNGNSGTFGASTAAPTYNNANGGSIVFDGTNDYIIKSTPSSLNFGSLDFSVFCWIKCTKKGAGTYGTPVTLDVGGSGNGILFYIDGSSGIFRTWVNGQALNGSIDVADNQWHYIGIVKFGTTATQFVDGVQRSSFACSSSLISSPNLILGNYTTTSIVEYAYNGNLSQVTIHSRALSAAEVAQNYDALKVRYTSYTNTFTPTCGGGSGKVEVLCVAGGGGGGGYAGGAGGGAGGLLYNSAFTVSSNTGIALTVGAGGTGGGGESDVASNSGSNTSFSSLISIGGGKGGHWSITASSGGSGGGGMSLSIDTLVLGGSGTLGQGNAGGSGLKTAVNAETSGGGGGAGGSGFNGASGIGGTGGLGLSYSISGVSQFYAGGGGGAVYAAGTSSGLGGSGVGGDATGPSGGNGKNGIPNTGSGGGGGGPFGVYGGNGSNGIVIVRYPATDYNVELLIVGGGGGGGGSTSSYGGGGGGGAGGLIYYSSYPVSAGTKYTVTVGAGGTGQNASTGANGSNGNNSVFGSVVAFGGGGGSNGSGAGTGNNGGSGGGGGYRVYTTVENGGFGISGQGNNGGGVSSVSASGAGGGGAGGVGQSNTGSGGGVGGVGGVGLTYAITGSSVTYAAGGQAGAGAAVPGSANTGNGGAGTYANSNSNTGYAGGSGIIIIAYQGPQRGVGGTVDTTSRPGYTLHKFTTTGTDFFIP